MNEYLEAVARAKQNLVDLERDLRVEFEKTLTQALSKAKDELSIAAGTAYKAGVSKAAIGRAMATKNFKTFNSYIDHGSALIEAIAPAHEPHLDSENIIPAFDKTDGFTYDRVTGEVFVTHMGDSATFEVSQWDDGTIILDSRTPLWDTGFEKRNEAVALLDGVNNGELYHKIVDYLNGVDAN